MVSLEQLKYDYWIAKKSVAAMRADLAGAEKELEAARKALEAGLFEQMKKDCEASARRRCGPVVVA